MRNWPVIVVLLAVLLGLLAAGYINKSKGSEHGRKGCFDNDVTLPDFIVLKSCPRDPATGGPLANILYSVRKTSIIAIADIKDANHCVRVSWASGRAFVWGSMEEITLRVQPGYIDYGNCGPAADDFMRALAGEAEFKRIEKK